MKARFVMAIGATVVAFAGGCSSAKEETPVATAPSIEPQPSSSIDADTLDATADYLTELGKIDKKLVGNTQAALDNGMEACVDIEERRTDAEQEKNVATRFKVDTTAAKKIIAVTKANLCLE